MRYLPTTGLDFVHNHVSRRKGMFWVYVCSVCILWFAIFLRRSRSPEMGLKGWDVYTGWAGKENGRSKGKWQGEAGVRATPLSFVVVFAGGMECRMALAYQS